MCENDFYILTFRPQIFSLEVSKAFLFPVSRKLETLDGLTGSSPLGRPHNNARPWCIHTTTL